MIFCFHVNMVRIAIIDKKKCTYGTKCPGICLNVCPVNRTGQDCVFIDDKNKAGINEDLCIGCNICVRKCPNQAIKIINLPEVLKEAPIHQYDKNGFRLFNLPIPIFGKVVGIIGKNGIGKTTALNILSGVLSPNFSKYNEKIDVCDYDKLISMFKGTEAQNFFEKIKNKEIKISYKPQHVDLIPKQFDGTVRQLLEKVDEKMRLIKFQKSLIC